MLSWDRKWRHTGKLPGTAPMFLSCGDDAYSWHAVRASALVLRSAPLARVTAYTHYRISKLCRVSVTLGKVQVTLGKVFAECNTRQTTLGKESHGNADFAECRITGTRQTICRVPWHSVNKPRGPPLVQRFAECLTSDTRQSPRVGGPPCTAT